MGLNALPCPKCNGAGCHYCNNIGAIGRDETNDYYLIKSSNDKLQVGGIITASSSQSILSKLISKVFEEPHDLLWSIKRKG